MKKIERDFSLSFAIFGLDGGVHFNVFMKKGEKPVFSKLARLIGNAVLVKLDEVIGQSFIKHVNGLPAVPVTSQ